jgi:hypothetical protein
MARKSDGEKIDELEKLAATLVERVDYVRTEMIDRERFAVIEDRINELKRSVEEASRRRWSIVPSVLGGVVGFVLTPLARLALAYLKR